jgi:hypothetical protein
MSRGILRLIAGLLVAYPAVMAAAQDASPRGPLPGVAVPRTISVPPAALGAAAAAPPPVSSPQRPVTISSTAGIYIAALQRALPSHGYHPGPETGRLDKRTIAAIKAYQRDAGLPVDARSEMNLKTTLDSVNFVKPPILAH